jgi:hypothetical protein
VEVEGLALGLGPARARGPPLTALSMAMQLNVDGTDCLHRHKHNFSGGWFVEDCLGRLRPPLDVLDADHLGALLKPGPVGAKEVLLGFLVLLVNVAEPVGVVLGRVTVGDRNDGSLLRLLRQRAS